MREALIFLAGLIVGAGLVTLVLAFARDRVLDHAARRDLAGQRLGRLALLSEQAGQHVRCEPGKPAA